jgi:alpha-beta hydrolase superfamily lysophospholipase
LKHRETRFPGCGDVQLFAQAWLPDRDPGALLVISHGLAEHGGRYRELASELVSRGYAVYALDHRGHGRSGGPRANVERFSYLVTDLNTFIGRAQREHPDAPLFLLGHSMGGLVALACATRDASLLTGLVLSAPALAAGQALSPLKLLLVRVLSALAPGTGALTLPAKAISRDPEVVRAYEQDPLVYRGAIPARTLAELLQAMAAFADGATGLRIPVLVQHGTGDQLVPVSATRPLYEKLATPALRTVRLYGGLYHEAYNEPERERVTSDLLAWLGAHD